MPWVFRARQGSSKRVNYRRLGEILESDELDFQYSVVKVRVKDLLVVAGENKLATDKHR